MVIPLKRDRAVRIRTMGSEPFHSCHHNRAIEANPWDEGIDRYFGISNRSMIEVR
jgi:hypothetical protein